MVKMPHQLLKWQHKQREEHGGVPYQTMQATMVEGNDLVNQLDCKIYHILRHLTINCS